MWSKINHSFRWRHWQRWTWAIMEWLPFPDSLSPIWMSIKQFVISFLPNKFLSSSFFLVCHDRECDERIRFFPTLLIEIEHCVFVTGLSHSLSVDSSSWEIVFFFVYITQLIWLFLFFKQSLTQLDLSHNYLRAVTSDLVGGLSSLESLDLTDNDISLVEPGALTILPKLIHLSLTGKQEAITRDGNRFDFLDLVIQLDV